MPALTPEGNERVESGNERKYTMEGQWRFSFLAKSPRFPALPVFWTGSSTAVHDTHHTHNTQNHTSRHGEGQGTGMVPETYNERRSRS